jgi:hypothetical protein
MSFRNVDFCISIDFSRRTKSSGTDQLDLAPNPKAGMQLKCRKRERKRAGTTSRTGTGKECKKHGRDEEIGAARTSASTAVATRTQCAEIEIQPELEARREKEKKCDHRVAGTSQKVHLVAVLYPSKADGVLFLRGGWGMNFIVDSTSNSLPCGNHRCLIRLLLPLARTGMAMVVTLL